MSEVIAQSLELWIPVIQCEFFEHPKRFLVLINAIVESQKMTPS
jgi:hypothetical protein